MISCRRTEIRSAHLALKGRPTVGDKGLKTPSSADNRLIDTTQTAREESEIFIRKPEVRDPRRVVGDVTLPPPSGGCQGCQLCLRMAQTCCQPRRLVVGMHGGAHDEHPFAPCHVAVWRTTGPLHLITNGVSLLKTI